VRTRKICVWIEEHVYKQERYAIRLGLREEDYERDEKA